MDIRDKYLELLKGTLTRTLCLEKGADIEKRKVGLDWPEEAETMIGLKRLDHIKWCIDQIMKDSIEGDLIECGVWRGGACIYMKAILDIYEDSRNVWVADSFKGFPDPTYNWDKGSDFLNEDRLAISRETVESNFKKYNVLDGNVKFLEGYFSETLPKFDGKLSLLRADGDLFQSTVDILTNLYDKVSVGGFVIIDDMLSLESCYNAVQQFRELHGITEQMYQVDHTCAYWRKQEG